MTPQEFFEYVLPFLGVLGVGAMVLIGMKLRYSHKAQLNRGAKPEEMERLTEAVDRLYDEMQTLRDGQVELQDRMEFAERLLTRGKSERPLEKADTPV